MKVCFITGEYPPMRGGVADYTETLARALHDFGALPCVVTSTRAAPKAPSSIPLYPAVDNWGFGAWGRVERLALETKADIVHLQYQTAAYGMHPAINFLPWWLHRRLNCRVVSTLHDLREPYLFPKAGRLRSWVNARLVADSDAAIVTNGEDLAEARRLAARARLILIPIASSIPVSLPPAFDRDLVRSRLGVNAGECLLTYFGILNQSKGVEFLLAALREVADRGQRVKLLMLGEEIGDADPTNRAYREKVLTMIEDLKLEEMVVRTGYVAADAVSAHLRASDVCVLPFADGASFRRTSLLTALEHGLPVVTTSGAPGGQSQLVSGENCLLAPPGDAETLANAIGELISSPALRDRLGRGAATLAKEFSWERIAEQHMQLYRALMSRAT
ncbi:MAG: glycosyltransferase family 4 protein [Chloroflexi bacterium]|nr:glycosyltransferase family 4 protein [Chloroflexota bacterium]